MQSIRLCLLVHASRFAFQIWLLIGPSQDLKVRGTGKKNSVFNVMLVQSFSTHRDSYFYP